MMLRIDPGDPTPVYEQIRSQVLTMITAGTLGPGDRLPTIRQLASDLGLAKGTVSKAYETLLHDGVIESRGRHGTVVASRPRRWGSAEKGARLADAAGQLALTASQLGASPDEAIRCFTAAWHQLADGAA
jgi:DNA-binding transcriptional regulator YhcF (GntR family)